MNRNNKKIAVVIAIIMLTLSIASTTFATNSIKNLQAYYKNIIIFKNGNQASFSNEPFIVDGTTYVPIRDMSELLGKTVTFNPATYRIDIADTADANTIALQTKLVQQEITIKNLESQIAALKAQHDNNDYDLDQLEEDLIDEFGEFDDVAIDDIKISGDEDDIEVEIYIDLDEYQTEWDDIEADIDEYLQAVVDFILDEFEDADIEGYVLDESNKGDEILKFTLSTKNKVVVGGNSTFDDADLDDLEDDLNEDLYDFYYKKDIYFEFSLYSDDDDEIEVIIDVYYDDDTEEYDLDDEEILDYVSESQVEDFLNEVYDYIIDIDEFEDADIFGEINGMNFEYDDGYSYLD